MSSLFDKVSLATRGEVVASFLIDPGVLATPMGDKCAEFIYRLRNSNVHFCPAMKAEKISDAKWNAIIVALCDVVLEVYKHFGALFLIVKTDPETFVESET